MQREFSPVYSTVNHSAGNLFCTGIYLSPLFRFFFWYTPKEEVPIPPSWGSAHSAQQVWITISPAVPRGPTPAGMVRMDGSRSRTLLLEARRHLTYIARLMSKSLRNTIVVLRHGLLCPRQTGLGPSVFQTLGFKNVLSHSTFSFKILNFLCITQPRLYSLVTKECVYWQQFL